MERNEIVKIFLDRGYMVDTASLDFFLVNQTMIQPFLDYYSDLKVKTGSIDINTVQELLKVKIKGIHLIKSASKKQKISVSDQALFLSKRYEAIRKIMNGRLDLINLVSINKISQKSKKFSVLGIVKQKNDETKSLILEDTTGEVEIFFSDNFFSEYEFVLHDDILGFICSNEFGRFYYMKTVWPDIPMAREVKKSKESLKCIFINVSGGEAPHKLLDWIEKSADDKTAAFIFSAREHSQNLRSVFEKLAPQLEKFFVEGTSVVSVSGLLFFLSDSNLYKKYQDFFKTTPEGTITSLLKRRNMNPNTDFDKFVYEEDPFILSEVPDVVVVSSFGEQSISNYKGTNIMTVADFVASNSALILDTKTREVIKVEIL